eukprot:3002726-Prymnesium_polylepis.1
MNCAARSPIIMQVACVLPLGGRGMTDASATRNRRTPSTRNRKSTTARPSEGSPSRQVPARWFTGSSERSHAGRPSERNCCGPHWMASSSSESLCSPRPGTSSARSMSRSGGAAATLRTCRRRRQYTHSSDPNA